MNNTDDSDTIKKLKEAFEAILPSDSLGKYPEEAVPIGTFVRPTRLDRLGIVVDAFYGDLDEDNQKIIVYTILTMPNNNTMINLTNKEKSQCFLSNEYEYDVIAYLMIKPCSAAFVSKIMGGIYYET